MALEILCGNCFGGNDLVVCEVGDLGALNLIRSTYVWL